MPYTLLEPALYLQATPGASYNTSNAITDVSTNPQYVLPPNTITTVGQTLRFHAGGIYSDTATPTLVLGIYKNTQTTAGATGVGGAALGATTTVTAGNTQSNLTWTIDLFCTFTAVGSGGTVLSYGESKLGLTTTTQTISMIPFTTPQTAVSFNTTLPNLLTVGATWSVNSASNIVICNQFTVSLMN
jgi:hypothetical protein